MRTLWECNICFVHRLKHLSCPCSGTGPCPCSGTGPYRQTGQMKDVQSLISWVSIMCIFHEYLMNEYFLWEILTRDTHEILSLVFKYYVIYWPNLTKWFKLQQIKRFLYIFYHHFKMAFKDHNNIETKCKNIEIAEVLR